MSGQSKSVPNPNVVNNRNSESDYLYNEEQESNYLDIWEKIPSYKDIKTKLSNSKVISMLIILLFLLILTYMNTSNLIFSIILTSFSLIFFIIAFHDNFFYLRNIFNGIFRKLRIINPFEDFAFWIVENDPATLLILNKNDAVTIGTRIFKIEILPENVHPTLNQFLQALNQAQLPFTYQVVQKPLINHTKNLSKRKNHQVQKPQNDNNNVSFQTSIYFSVYKKARGMLTKTRLIKLIKSVHGYSKVLKSNFSANFHHTKITLLTGNTLINNPELERRFS